MMKVVYKGFYKGGEGFAVGVVKKAPRSARTKADVIAIATIKKTQRGPNKGKRRGVMNYYTPDEAMCIGIGLIRACDHVMMKHMMHFRAYKDKQEA